MKQKKIWTTRTIRQNLESILFSLLPPAIVSDVRHLKITICYIARYNVKLNIESYIPTKLGGGGGGKGGQIRSVSLNGNFLDNNYKHTRQIAGK